MFFFSTHCWVLDTIAYYDSVWTKCRGKVNGVAAIHTEIIKKENGQSDDVRRDITGLAVL